jgi:diguanylate cyclase (GGDEF)-like protein
MYEATMAGAPINNEEPPPDGTERQPEAASDSVPDSEDSDREVTRGGLEPIRVPSASGRRKAVDLYLEESGQVQQHLIEIAAMDVERDLGHETLLEQQKASNPETFYSDLIYTLSHLRYEEAEARVLWVNLLSHKYDISYRLGRNVGIRVAALDYFKNVIAILDDVKIIDSAEYIETAQLAVTDGLTGVFNHRYFQDRLLRDINRIKEEGGCLTLIMVDIDHFKLYNDFNGHIAGDVALKEVASVLRNNLKKEDLVARYGGEEFAVILWGLDRYPAETVAERIRAKVESTSFPNEKVLPGGNLTVSMGMAECPDDADDRGELISAADRALYTAKRLGRNRVEMAPPDQRREVRCRLSRRAAYRPEGEPQTPMVEAQTVNLSTGGVCLYSRGSVLAGQMLDLMLTDRGEERHLKGRVVWCVHRPHDVQQVGVKFVDVRSDDAAWLESIVSR